MPVCLAPEEVHLPTFTLPGTRQRSVFTLPTESTTSNSPLQACAAGPQALAPQNCMRRQARLPASLLLAGLLSLALQPALAQQDANSTAVELLLDFKASFANGDTVLANWTDDGSSPCSWLYIVCGADGEVVEM
jgi:hypothetical protein